MYLINKIAVGAAAFIFLGYCVYYDYKRRTDPDYMKKVRERRALEREAEAMEAKLNSSEIDKLVEHNIAVAFHLIQRNAVEDGLELIAHTIFLSEEPLPLINRIEAILPEHQDNLVTKVQRLYSQMRQE